MNQSFLATWELKDSKIKMFIGQMPAVARSSADESCETEPYVKCAMKTKNVSCGVGGDDVLQATPFHNTCSHFIYC